jgi:hypothetical protein
MKCTKPATISKTNGVERYRETWLTIIRPHDKSIAKGNLSIFLLIHEDNIGDLMTNDFAYPINRRQVAKYLTPTLQQVRTQF